ncbi:hypothetical protein [Shewanella metallivivens]|uniref:Uncharacterized protein n=1 Tax=Shewanella metallivivens TaxID=2872342 RepID=A0ABT5TLY9_9GAMM|nr:hypothetical protein [Shewanella metallivivens]MDD8059223.1 hypothetical protein [Shewanella metallivivens]
MIDDKKIPLSQLSNGSDKIRNVQFAVDRIVWKVGEPTQFPSNLLDDSFAKALIKYFNSPYFRKNVSESSSLSHYRRSVDVYLAVMSFNNFTETPVDSIYHLIEAYLKKQVEDKVLSSTLEYRIYNAIKSPAHTLSKVRVTTRKQKNLPLLRSIDFTEDERLSLVLAGKNANKKANPEKDDKSINARVGDIIDQLELGFEDASAFMISMRAFCAFYISEWGAIRDAIFEQFPNEIARHIARYEAGKDCHMSNAVIEGNKSSGISLFNPQVCFDITKGINHPLLTERFVTEYMAVNSGKKNLSEAAKTIWDWSSKQSTSSEYDWISVIEKQYTSTSSLRARKLCYASSDYTKKLGGDLYKNTEEQFRGTLLSVFPTKEILGISKAEEICMACILSSDRHQPANLRWMTLGDITVTDNSVSTIIDVDSFKRRASLTSGRDYDDLNEDYCSFNVDSGETYKRNQGIYNALLCYRDQLLRSHSLGMSEKEKQYREDDLWMFDGIRFSNKTKMNGAALVGKYFKFFRGYESNFGITLCAIEGTLSNKYVLEKCPQAALFLENVSKIYEPNPTKVNPDTGVKPLAMNLISKAALNLKAAKRYSSAEITVKDISRIEVDDRHSVLATERDAALDFHTPKTRTQYVDKLPDYLTESVDFGARVGDEFVRMAKELSLSEYNSSAVMSMADIRAKLGIQTTAEKEIEQLNDLFSKLNNEGAVFNDLGIIKERDQKIIIIRHPIVIAKIKNEIAVIDKQLYRLGYSNSERVKKALVKYMYLNMILREKFTPAEIKESDDLYGDVELPSGDILI